MVKVGVMVGDMDVALVLEVSPLPLAVPLLCPLPLPTPLTVALEDTVGIEVEEKEPLGDPVPTPEALIKGVSVPLEVNKVEGVRIGVEVKVRKGVFETKGVKVDTGLTLGLGDPVISAGEGVVRALKVLFARPPTPLELVEGSGEGEVEVDTVPPFPIPSEVNVPTGESVGG